MEWPDCLICGDSGVIDSGKVFGDKRPCRCSAGKQQENGYEKWKTKQSERIEANEAVADAYKKEAQRANKLNAEQAAERASYEERHICPDCKGEKKLNSQTCGPCNGTGQFYTFKELTDARKCPICYGIGQRGGRPCMACHGSQAWSPMSKVKSKSDLRFGEI